MIAAGNRVPAPGSWRGGGERPRWAGDLARVCGAAALVLVLAAPARGREPAHGSATPGSDRATATHSFADVAQWKSVFDDPARDAWQKPKELVAALRLEPGMAVADLGAGTGYLSRYLAAAVGPAGVVYAVEPEPNLVAHLRERAEREGTANLVPVLASVDNPRLPPGRVDLVLILDTYHHLDHRRAYLSGLRRVLRAQGRVAVVDWHERPLPEGPPPDHKLAPERVIEEMSAAGYTLAESLDFLPYQYVLIFRPAP